MDPPNVPYLANSEQTSCHQNDVTRPTLLYLPDHFFGRNRPPMSAYKIVNFTHNISNLGIEYAKVCYWNTIFASYKLKRRDSIFITDPFDTKHTQPYARPQTSQLGRGFLNPIKTGTKLLPSIKSHFSLPREIQKFGIPLCKTLLNWYFPRVVTLDPVWPRLEGQPGYFLPRQGLSTHAQD